MPVKTTGSHERRVEHVRTVRRRHDHNGIVLFKSVHFAQDLIQRLFALVLTAASDLYRYVPIGQTDAELPVASGDMLFNVFDEYLGFLQA